MNTGGKPLNGAVFLNDELLKIPANVTSVSISISRLAKRFVESETVSTVDIALGHQGKRDVELGRRELADFIVGPWLLRAELIAGKANHGQVVVSLVEGLEAGVLWRSAAGAGDIDDHPTGPAEVSKRGGFAVHGRKGDVNGVAHGSFLKVVNINLCFCADEANPLQVPLCGRGMQVLMETSAGNITIDLFHGSAPDTVANFVRLVNAGHYDGLHFHRVIEDFMIQGGCPHSKDPMSRRAGTGGPGWQIPCEPSALALKHDKPGVLSMANAGRNTGGSQFFLTTVPTPWLNGNHAVFGAVSEGMDIVHTIERCRKLPGDRPAEPQQIIRCTVIE